MPHWPTSRYNDKLTIDEIEVIVVGTDGKCIQDEITLCPRNLRKLGEDGLGSGIIMSSKNLLNRILETEALGEVICGSSRCHVSDRSASENSCGGRRA